MNAGPGVAHYDWAAYVFTVLVKPVQAAGNAM